MGQIGDRRAVPALLDVVRNLDKLTIADIARYPWVRGWKWSKSDITGHANVVAWVDRVRARPAVERGLAIASTLDSCRCIHIIRPSRIGSSLIRIPVAAKIAFVMAGATGASGPSPTPRGALLFRTKCTSTSGVSLRRHIG